MSQQQQVLSAATINSIRSSISISNMQKEQSVWMTWKVCAKPTPAPANPQKPIQYNWITEDITDDEDEETKENGRQNFQDLVERYHSIKKTAYENALNELKFAGLFKKW
jgi:hypothetical protein